MKVFSPYQLLQFDKVLNKDTIDMKELRKLSWNGIPYQHRPLIWQILLGYIPIKRDRREEILTRKRREYHDSVPTYYANNVPTDVEGGGDRTTQDGELYRQIMVDLPRTCPDSPFFHQEPVRKIMERILYIWSIRHPSSGYVQGMNDILTPLLLICLQTFVEEPLRCDVMSLDPLILTHVEGDCYWCFTKLMDNIQDHYTFSQPGLQRMSTRLEDLIKRIDHDLYNHFEIEGIQILQFGFRWLNCLLIRELPLKSLLRVWDTYLSEEVSGFENFHVYVCAVIVKTYRDKLINMKFQEMIMFLQDLPTSEWTDADVEPVLSQAFILSTLFDNAPSHLGNKS